MTNLSEDLLALIRCPSSQQALTRSGNQLISVDSEYSYPVIQNIPWLLPNPSNSIVDWSAKLNYFKQVLLTEVGTLQAEIQKSPKLSLPRLEKLLTAKQSFVTQVSQLMSPLTSTKMAPKAIYDAFYDRAPSTQNLLSYEANLYRDWIWGDEENQLSQDIVLQEIRNLKPQKLIVLGAGACRLTYDIHRAIAPQITVATDINPLFLLAVEHIFSGQDLTLYEFPNNPRNIDVIAVEQTFKGLEKWPDNLHLLFSDAATPPFPPGAFDIVLTPWLIDIQPLEFSYFLKRLNHYIPKGGHWVNFGSLVFNQKRDAFCYAIDELEELAENNGFKIKNIKEHEIPYLKSPDNAGYRMERVWTWQAEKILSIEQQSTPQNFPTWLTDPQQPVPVTRYFQSFTMTHKMYANLASEIDGRQSIQKIARKMARKNNMDTNEATKMVRDFLVKIYSQNL